LELELELGFFIILSVSGLDTTSYNFSRK